MKCILNAGRLKQMDGERPTEGQGRSERICQGQRQKQAKRKKWQQVSVTTSVRKTWLLMMMLLLALTQHAQATTVTATTATQIQTAAAAAAGIGKTANNSNSTTTTASAGAAAGATSSTSSSGPGVGGIKSSTNWEAPLEDPFKNIVRIGDGNTVLRTAVEQSLVTIHDIATENLGTLCISTLYRPLQVPINSERYESSRQKADLAASILQEVGIIRHGGLSDALAKGLLTDEFITGARILALNLTNGAVQSYVWWVKGSQDKVLGEGETQRYNEEGLQIGKKPANSYPWFDDETSTPSLRSPKFAPSPPNNYYKGWWTYPYFSCALSKWLVSYSIAIPPSGRHGLRGFISIDINVSTLRVNQCEGGLSGFSTYQSGSHQKKLMTMMMLRRPQGRMAGGVVGVGGGSGGGGGGKLITSDVDFINDLQAFHGSHKCHRNSMVCDYRQPSPNLDSTTITGGKILSALTSSSWSRGSYQCLCKRGYYSLRHPDGFNGTIMEIAWQEHQDNISNYYTEVFKCFACAPGCDQCTGPEPCLANFHWPFRISLLTISIGCACGTFILAGYLFRHRRVKVFKVASPIFLMITLIGCAIMYLEGGQDGKPPPPLQKRGEDLPAPSSDTESDEDEAALHAALRETVKIPDISDHRLRYRRRYYNQDGNDSDDEDEEEEERVQMRPEHYVERLVKQSEFHRLKSMQSKTNLQETNKSPLNTFPKRESKIVGKSSEIASKNSGYFGKHEQEKNDHVSEMLSPLELLEPSLRTPLAAEHITPDMQLKWQRLEAASRPKYYKSPFPSLSTPSSRNDTQVIGTQTPPLYSYLETDEKAEKLMVPQFATSKNQTGIINILTGPFRRPLNYESDGGAVKRTAEAGTITNPEEIKNATLDPIQEGSVIMEPKPIPLPPPAPASDFDIVIEETKPHIIMEPEKECTESKLPHSESMKTLTITGHSHITTRWLDHCHFERQNEGVDRVARRKLIIACVLCVLFMTAEIVGGILSNSLAIATDAAHLLTDLAGFLISLFALFISARPSTQRMSFGWYRAEVIGAMISVYFIWVITGILVWLACQRLWTGQHDVDAKIMLITSGLAILVNIIMAVQLTHGHSHNPSEAARQPRLKTKESRLTLVSASAKRTELEMGLKHANDPPALVATSVSRQWVQEAHPENINVRAAVIHVIGDMIQSIGVFVAAIVIFFVPQWAMIDSICTFIFSIIVLYVTFRILRDVLMVLMEATPDYMDYEEVQRTFLSIDGVLHVHNLRIWAISINKVALSAHLAIEKDADPQMILEKATELIHRRYRFFETTIQIEEYTPGMENCVQCTTPLVRRSKELDSSITLGVMEEGAAGINDRKNEIVTHPKGANL